MTRSRSLKTTAQIASGLPWRTGQSIPVTLEWDRTVPFEVSICFHDEALGEEITWLFSRDLLCAAYANPEAVYGDGDLQCSLGKQELIVRIVIMPRSVLFRLDAEAVAAFLEGTLGEAPIDQEMAEQPIDDAISSILDEAGA